MVHAANENAKKTPMSKRKNGKYVENEKWGKKSKVNPISSSYIFGKLNSICK